MNKTITPPKNAKSTTYIIHNEFTVRSNREPQIAIKIKFNENVKGWERKKLFIRRAKKIKKNSSISMG